MKHLKIRRFFSMLVIVLSALLLGTTAAQANVVRNDAHSIVAVAKAQCGQWSVVPSPNVDTGDTALGAVAAASANDIWAVGNQVDANSGIAQNLIEHWNGTAWTIVASPNVGQFGNTLLGVAAISANKAWAVGYAIGKDHLAKTLIEQWNGQSWNVVSSPNPGNTYNLLNSVTAVSANDAWAVGFAQSAGQFQTLIEHWNGTKWQTVSSPNPGESNNLLYGVNAVSASDIWAVGQYLDEGPADQSLIEHWNGSSWHVVSHSTTSTSSALFGVTAKAGRVWAAGQIGGVNAPTKPFSEQESNGQWNALTLPHVGTLDNQLLGVAAATSTDVWAVGHYVDVTSGNDQTLIENSSDGKTWKIVSSPSPGIGGNNILGGVVALSSHDIWAVGGYDSGNNTMTLVEHYC